VRFNLSYCRDYVACAVTHDADVGIDVEVAQPIDSIRKTASRYLSKHELDTLASVSNRTYVSRFLTYWTLKEAYLKSRGKGFVIAPNMISFHAEDENAIRVEIDRSLDDDPSAWQFALTRPTSSHTMALAVRGKKSGSFNIVPYSLEPREFLKHADRHRVLAS
jgi:4'-phosphopantetheinyl transferase